jgi:AsmA family protein
MDSATIATPARNRPAIWARNLLVSVFAFIVLLFTVLALIPDSTWRSLLVKAISAQTNRKATIAGETKVHLFSLNPSVNVGDFSLANADWISGRPMIKVEHVSATLSLVSLLRLHLVFARVEIRGPEIDLERDKDGRANWDFTTPGARVAPQRPSKAASLPAIQQFILSAGNLTASDAVRELKFKGEMTVAERNGGRGESALHLRGTGVLNGKPFDLRVQGGPLLDVDPAKPYGLDAEVHAADIRLEAHVVVKHPFDLGSVTSKFHVSGKDLADVYYLTGLALPNTPPYDLSGTVLRDNLKFTVEDFKGRLGGSDIGGTVSIDGDRDRPLLRADLRSALLNIEDLAAPLGTQASAENKSDSLAQSTGQSSETNPKSKARKRARPAVAKVDLQAKDTGFLLPDADLQVKRVRGMDAEVKYRAESIHTERVPIEKLQLSLRLDNGKISIDPLNFTLPEGQFSGTVAVNAKLDIPVTDLDMRLDHADLAQIKAKGSTDAPLGGQMVGRIRLHGAGSSVHKMAANSTGDVTFVIPSGQIRAALAELTGINVAKGLNLLLTKKEEKTEIRCGIASFRAEDGDLKAQSLLMDTTHVLVTGGGDINLKDEGLHIELRGKPKEIRMVRVRTPIEIHGTLAHPDIGVEPGHVLAQAGGAAALGVLLTPVAAVLAFVDGGLAKNANCAALIQQTEESRGLSTALSD